MKELRTNLVVASVKWELSRATIDLLKVAGPDAKRELRDRFNVFSRACDDEGPVSLETVSRYLNGAVKRNQGYEDVGHERFLRFLAVIDHKVLVKILST